MGNQTVIATLNNLLETTKDGAQGFRTCAGAVSNSRLRTVFEVAARRCDEAALELEGKIRGLGSEPAPSGTITGSLHRFWTNIISSISGMDERAVLAECEHGEEFAERAYMAALQEHLPGDIEAMVRRQYEGVKKNLDLVRELKIQLA
jgi:uncharacterized protein (TIGR02284 family)